MVKERQEISIDEAATLLKLSAVTIYRLFNRGELDGYRKTRSGKSPIVIYRDSVVRYAKEVQGRDV